MKHETLIVGIIAVIAIALVAYTAVRQHSVEDALRAELKQTQDTAMDAIRKLANENKSLSAENATLKVSEEEAKATAAQKETELAGVRVMLATSEHEREALKQQMQTGPIIDVLRKTQDILVTTEVTLIENDTAARFSLAAFRKNAVALVEWQRFTLTDIPQYKQALSLSLAQTEALKAALAAADKQAKNDASIIANKDEALTKINEVVVAQDKVIKTDKKNALKRDVLIAIIAGIFGFVIAK